MTLGGQRSGGVEMMRLALTMAFVLMPVFKEAAAAKTMVRPDYIDYVCGIRGGQSKTYFRGPRKIAGACGRRRLWGEQHRIGRGTNRNHSRAISGRLTSGGDFSRSPQSTRGTACFGFCFDC